MAPHNKLTPATAQAWNGPHSARKKSTTESRMMLEGQRRTSRNWSSDCELQPAQSRSRSRSAQAEQAPRLRCFYDKGGLRVETMDSRDCRWNMQKLSTHDEEAHERPKEYWHICFVLRD